MELTGWSEGFARVEMAVSDKVMNRQGIPHGGVHATLMDSAMGYSGCYTGDPDARQMALTLSLTINYLAQAQGARLIAEGRVTGGGRKTYFAESSLRDDHGHAHRHRHGRVQAAQHGLIRVSCTPTLDLPVTGSPM
jgi:uncharacterized protein (TIGR00369 family)